MPIIGARAEQRGHGPRMNDEMTGGFRTQVEKRGDRVFRTHPQPISPYTWPTLRLLGEHLWSGAPRLIASGTREELTYLPGLVPQRDQCPEWATAPDALQAVGRLIRELHDLTADTEIAGDAEVICHNDLSPANTVYDPETLLPYAFIDWDLAAPGKRIADLGHAAWQWLNLGPAAEILEAARGVRELLSGYGHNFAVRDVLEAAIQWQLDTAYGIEAGASDDPSLAALMHNGTPEECRRAADWTRAHLDALANPALA